MTLTADICSEIIRQRLGATDDSIGAKVITQIPQALKKLGRLAAADPALRPLLQSEKSTATLALGTGAKVSLANAFDNYHIMQEWIDCGQIYLLGRASGIWTFNSIPVHGETIVVNGVSFAFVYPSVVVSGAGTSSVNGTYAYTGTHTSQPFWNKAGVSPTVTSISTPDGVNWNIYGSPPVYNTVDIAFPVFPWLGTWALGTGSNPAPFVAEGSLTTVQVAIGATVQECAVNFAAALNASSNPAISVATYTADNAEVSGVFDTTGTAGNAFTMAASSADAVTVSGSTFSGGTEGDTQLQRLASPQQASLPRYLDSVFTYFYVQGEILYVLPDTTEGTLVFGVPTYPLTLADMPDSKELENQFLDVLYGLVAPPYVPYSNRRGQQPAA
jgi:hypothetical protein